MANPGPGITPRLYTMPTEITAHIASLLHVNELDGVTRASRVCRLLFGPRMFCRIAIAGCEKELSEDLHMLAQTSVSSNCGIDIRNWIRYLQIHLEFRVPPSFRRSVWSRALDSRSNHSAVVEELPQQIISAIRSISNLKSLVLDLHFLSKEMMSAFLKLSDAMDLTIPELRIAAPDELMELIIEHFDFQALHVFNYPCPDRYAQSVTHLSRLKRLHVTVNLDSGSRPMDAGFLRKVNEDFEHLQWLVICENRSTSNDDDYNFFEEFEASIEDFVCAMKNFQNLKRFAFTIWKSEMDLVLVPTNHEHDSDLADIHLKNWVLALATHMGEALPKLEELCIMLEYPELIRCTRDQDGVPMDAKWMYYGKVKPITGFPFDILE
ncbi:hypothetical protein AK830_g1104 [Neonectria ditissima]|uniref:F-box domain-containing protein n=1 Tax=Neonectria ditissima TaxID=78410 RepID=A0A0P7BVF6_9HYPO|nr:hypothetical protein AK830_g1104 [Neonectria ditissima]